MDLLNIMVVSGGGMNAQTTRMKIAAENLANENSVQSMDGSGPYRAKQVYFETVLNRQTGMNEVKVNRVANDMNTPLNQRYEPGHDMADGRGYVAYPNVNGTIESINMREAQRSYEANMAAMTTTREMVTRTLDMMR